MRKAPPPFLAAWAGKRRKFPRPTALPAMARTRPTREAQRSVVVIREPPGVDGRADVVAGRAPIVNGAPRGFVPEGPGATLWRMRLGSVPYLNALPLVQGLAGRADLSLAEDVPARLVPRLRAGELDAALCSAVELFR
ncbi:MAG: hypothetical protein FJ296_01280, partial [Planctomycetes bacterium]|nr:hypothetical protein [Planctomycetota bacterium]